REEPEDAMTPGEAEAEACHRHRRRGDRANEHRPPAHAIGETSPDRDEEELHQRVDRSEQGGDRLAHAEGVARLLRQERQDEPEAQDRKSTRLNSVTWPSRMPSSA